MLLSLSRNSNGAWRRDSTVVSINSLELNQQGLVKAAARAVLMMGDVLGVNGEVFHCIEQHAYSVLIREKCRHVTDVRMQRAVRVIGDGDGESHDLLGVEPSAIVKKGGY